MKKSILGLRTSIYYVPDVVKARDWYIKAFETQPYYDTPYYVGFNIGGYELGLHPEGEKPIGQTRTHNVEAYWGVEEIDAQHNRFLSLGATERTAPQNVGGDIMVSTVLDPWGNSIGLIYNPDFKLP